MNTRLYGSLLLAVLLVAPAAVAQSGEPMHARISYDSGGSMVKGSDDADWSYATVNTLVLPGDALWVDQDGTLELEMAGGSFLRMADGSKGEITNLPPDGRVRGWVGSFYVQRVTRSAGTFVFETPVCAVAIDRDTQVRLDLVRDGATTVTVRWGRATVMTGTGRDVELRQGERSYVDPGYLPSAPTRFSLDQEDAFDAWNRERARLLALGSEPPPVQTITKSVPIGYSDLAPYGEWINVDSAYYWRPTVVVDYIPYRTGHWSFVPGCGYTWVGNYPFCYVTSHYGRWTYNPDYGWLWTYRDVWSPAWVYSMRVGQNFVWTPLDPWDRPCQITSTQIFDLGGGVTFSLSTTTFCPADQLLMGPCLVRPCTPVIFDHIPTNQINIWNINIGGRPPTFRPTSNVFSVRDYSPRRVIRGMDVLEGLKDHARARVATLETTHGRPQFDSDQAQVRHNVRTQEKPEKRAAQVRTPRISERAMEDVRQTTQRWGSDHPTPRIREKTNDDVKTVTMPIGRSKKPENVDNLPLPMRPRGTDEKIDGTTPPVGTTGGRAPKDLKEIEPSVSDGPRTNNRGINTGRSVDTGSTEPASPNTGSRSWTLREQNTGRTQNPVQQRTIETPQETQQPRNLSTADSGQRRVIETHPEPAEPRTPTITRHVDTQDTRTFRRTEPTEPTITTRPQRIQEVEKPREIERPRDIPRSQEPPRPMQIQEPQRNLNPIQRDTRTIDAPSTGRSISDSARSDTTRGDTNTNQSNRSRSK